METIAYVYLSDPQQRSQSVLIKLAEACLRFSPQIALHRDEGLWIEVGKSRAFFSEASIRARILILAQHFGVQVQVAFASTVFLARFQVHFPKVALLDAPIDALFCFMNPFLSVGPAFAAMIEKLKALGIETLAGFLKLPKRSLGSRLGGIAVELHSRLESQVNGQTSELTLVWERFRPSPVLEEGFDFSGEGPVETLEPLLFGLKTLTDRVTKRLRGLSKRVAQVQIEARLAPWSVVKEPVRVWRVSFSIAQGSTAGMMPVFQERLSYECSRHPFLSPVQSLKLTVLETISAYSAQKNFFHSQEEEYEKWDEFLSRMNARLGEGSIFQAQVLDTYCPEKKWSKLLKPEAQDLKPVPLNSCLPQRPTRLLKVPQAFKLPFSKILKWEGPERISTQWWTPGEALDRDYYWIWTQAHEVLWVYVDRTQRQLFLHGYLD